MLPSLHWSAHRRRLKDERGAGWLTACQYDVLIAIADLFEAGVVNPTVAKIALYAMVSIATVRRARAKGEARGLLLCEAQYEVLDGRRQQRANRYEPLVPEGVVTPKPRPPRGNQKARPIGRQEERRLGKGCESTANLLLARQRAMQQIQLAARMNQLRR